MLVIYLGLDPRKFWYRVGQEPGEGKNLTEKRPETLNIVVWELGSAGQHLSQLRSGEDAAVRAASGDINGHPFGALGHNKQF